MQEQEAIQYALDRPHKQKCGRFTSTAIRVG